jgi:RNA polymerase sigma factor (sigma-70 family)
VPVQAIADDPSRAFDYTTRGNMVAVITNGTAILGMGNLGAVCNFEYALPRTDSPADIAAAKRYDGIYNRWFLGGMFRKEYPADVLEALLPHMPDGWQDDMDTVAPLMGEDGREITENRIYLAQVRRAMETLPEEQRAVLMLVCVEGLRYREVAAALDIPEGTVMSRLSRGRLALAAALQMTSQGQGLGQTPGQSAGLTQGTKP